MRHTKIALLKLALCVAAVSSFSIRASAAAWRFGSHDNFERVVVPLAAASAYQATALTDGSYVITSEGFAALPVGSATGKLILMLSGTEKRVSIKLAPNLTPKLWRSGDRLVIDVFAAAKVVARPSAAPSPVPLVKVTPLALSQPAIRPIHAPSEATMKLPATLKLKRAEQKFSAPAEKPEIRAPVVAPNSSPAVSVELHASTSEFPSGYFLVPAPADVGAAAFVRDGVAQIVFDAPLSLDIASLKDDPAYGGASLHALPGGTQMQIRGGTPKGLRLLRRPTGWLVAFSNAPAGNAPIAASEDHGRILLAAATPSAVVAIEDAQTGARLLVGTMRKDGAYAAAGRETPEFILAPTMLGIVVSPKTDRVDLKTVASGFELRRVVGHAACRIGASDCAGDIDGRSSNDKALRLSRPSGFNAAQSPPRRLARCGGRAEGYTYRSQTSGRSGYARLGFGYRSRSRVVRGRSRRPCLRPG